MLSFLKWYLHGPVVQLVRMPACHAGGRGFEPHPDRQYFFCRYASVAQSVEQRTENPRVGGSIPPGGTIHIFKRCEYNIKRCGSGSVVERHLAKVNVASSNLVFRSNKRQNDASLTRHFVLKTKYGAIAKW